MGLTEAQQAVYMENLQGYPSEALRLAIDWTIQQWDKPCIAPSVAFILHRVHAAVEQIRQEQARVSEERAKLEAVKEARFLGSADPEGDVERRRQWFIDALTEAGLKASVEALRRRA